MFDEYSLRRAVALAADFHHSQLYGEHPYMKHLADVYNVLVEFGYTHKELLAAAWLHDILEDTSMTREHLETTFGKDVATLVWRVTDEPGENRAARKKATYPKIRESFYATALKLADRIANVREGLRTNSPQYKMYQREHAEFWAALYFGAGPNQHLWDELTRLLTAKVEKLAA